MLLRSEEPKPIEVRFRLRKSFWTQCSSIVLDRYQIHPLPLGENGESEAVLCFDYNLKSGYANPEGEAKIILQIMELLFNTKIKKNGLRINNRDMGLQTEVRLSPFEGQITELDYGRVFANAASLSDNVTKQFIRSCNAYSLAIEASDLDHSLAFLMLVVSIEALSSCQDVIPDAEIPRKNSTERYCEFVRRFSGLLTDATEVEYTKHLKTIYYVHRSAFVHAAHEVSIASSVADKHDLVAINHFVDDVEVFTPGLIWFFHVVRSSLLGFLDQFSGKTQSVNSEIFSEIAKKRSVLTMRVGEDGVKEE